MNRYEQQFYATIEKIAKAQERQADALALMAGLMALEATWDLNTETDALARKVSEEANK